MTLKTNKFWATYFIIRLFYLVFTILVYGRLTILGDTGRYLNASRSMTLDLIYRSTSLMDFIGSIFGRLGGNILSHFPFMLLSFFTIKWVVEKCEFRKYINKYILLVVLSLPNFCIWTSVLSKETFGLVFSAILGYWLISFLRGDFIFRKIYILGIYLCGLFKSQYLPFILQTLAFIYLCHKFKGLAQRGFIFTAIMTLNICVLIAVSDIVNELARGMHLYFAVSTSSTREGNIFLEDYSFFWHSPQGMFVAFFGPTLSEMYNNPLHLIAGLESLFILVVIFSLLKKMFTRLVQTKMHSVYVPAVFLLYTGIAFVHYPFGIYNPGAAIRYRTNFIFIFILLALEIYRQYREGYNKKHLY